LTHTSRVRICSGGSACYNSLPPMNAVIYCRVSTVKQAERNEANLPSQEKKCQDWCRVNNLNVTRVFVAEGESAWDTTRPVFEEALDFVQKHKSTVSHFVVADLSRFSRNIVTQGIALKRLEKLKVKFISVDEPSIDETPVGKLLSSVLGAVSEFHSHSLSSRVRYRFHVNREAGRWLHQAPLGYKNARKSLVPDDAAPLVKEAFEMMATGAYSSDHVRKFVTAAGLRTKKGRKLNRQTFSFVLKNPVYAGLIAHNGQTYKGDFPALVSEKIWQSVQDTLRGKRKAAPKKTVDDRFPLRGFVICGYCQSKLTSGNVRGRSKSYPKYWCWNKKCEHPISVSSEKLEADWLEYLERMQPAFDKWVNVLPVLARTNAQKRIEDAEQRQRHLAGQLEEKKAMRLSLFESKVRGDLTQIEFREMADMLAHDIEAIESARCAFVAEAAEVLHLTADTSRTTIPAKVLWATALLSDKLTVQNCLFPEGIWYRKDIGFFTPPTCDLQLMVFKLLISMAAEPDWEEIKSGRDEWI
jgi:site-specific DNA recombinase